MDKIELARWANNFATKKGAKDVRVQINNQRNISIEFRDGKIDKLQESAKNSLSLDVFVDNKYSSQSTNDMRKSELEKFIEEAILSTKFLAEDSFRSLPNPKYYPKILPNILLRDSDYEKILTEKRVEIAQEIEKIAKKQSDKIISVTSRYSDTLSSSVLLQSNGFEGTTEGTAFSFGAEISVNDPNGSRPNEGAYASARIFNKLPDYETIAKLAAQRTLNRIGQTKIESGKYDMLIENKATSTLIRVLLGAMAASAIQQKRSFLDGKLGQKITSEILSITDNPFLAGGLASRKYDDEGMESKELPMIEKGILRNFYVDTYYGKKINMKPTTGRSSNLVLGLGSRNIDEMIKTTQKGILVESFNGGNSNATTGDFSYGVSGMLIENGVIVKPINEMIISGNLLTLWATLYEVGNDPYQYSSLLSPTLLFKDVDFSGK